MHASRSLHPLNFGQGSNFASFLQWTLSVWPCLGQKPTKTELLAVQRDSVQREGHAVPIDGAGYTSIGLSLRSSSALVLQ